ncbi:MAG: hypothetical protein ACK4FF_13110 [Limnobacter sp.]|uniref:hypothetical protein n=1 Tax=Limnobacter sp. TaxID=2003368 RepID=UPI0039190B92
MTARFRSDTFFRVAILPSNLQVTLDHLRSSAKALPTGQCAKFVRLALQAGGFKLVHQPISAKDYGPTLAAAGFVAHDLSDDVLTG